VFPAIVPAGYGDSDLGRMIGMQIRVLSIENKITLIVTAGFTLAAIIVGTYFLRAEKQHVESLLLKQADTLFNQIQEARHWNAGHGGVYARLNAGEKPNPYLYKVFPGKGEPSLVEPEITDLKGRRYALINPALMTREIAAESREHTDIRFHLTSLKLINPDNAPDIFEKKALQSFEQGKKRQFEYVDVAGKPYFRYMAPLQSSVIV